MDRTPQRQTGQSRRWTSGVTFVAAATVALIATTFASSHAHLAGETTFPNQYGALGIVGIDERDSDNPFFQELGTNGRKCVTCHQPAQAWSITPAELRDRFVNIPSGGRTRLNVWISACRWALKSAGGMTHGSLPIALSCAAKPGSLAALAMPSYSDASTGAGMLGGP